MERAVRLAESMDSRGFGRDTTQGETVAGWFGLSSIILLAGCFVALVARARSTAAALALIGFGSLVAAVVLTSRASRRARYRRRHIERSEWAFAAVAWAAPAGAIVASAIGDHSLVWPGDVLAMPTVSLLPLAALVALAVPAFAKPRPS
jgi:small-conductance mechanosensitive channel